MQVARRTRAYDAPSSVSCMGCSCLTKGTLNCTSPPPRGRAPRFTILSSSPGSSTPSRLSSGKVTVRTTSTPTSTRSFVTPLSVIERFCAEQRVTKPVLRVPPRRFVLQSRVPWPQSSAPRLSDVLLVKPGSARWGLAELGCMYAGVGPAKSCVCLGLPQCSGAAVLAACQGSIAYLLAPQGQEYERLEEPAHAARSTAVVHEPAAHDDPRPVADAGACTHQNMY